MKHLKSSFRDLHRLFEQSITVRDIAEPLSSFDESYPAEAAREFMEERDYDVVGVRNEGAITGFVERSDLREGVVGDVSRPFGEGEVVEESEPLLTALETLKTGRWVFVQFLGNPSGIVTRGDLQKAPMRMWLFGLLSLFEMQLLRRIRSSHGDESWKRYLGDDRIEEASRILSLRKERNEAIDLADCLQIADKKMIFAKSEVLSKLIAPMSRRSWEKFMRDVERLRNNLAHANDLGSEDWPKIAETVEQLESLLGTLESVSRQ